MSGNSSPYQGLPHFLEIYRSISSLMMKYFILQEIEVNLMTSLRKYPRIDSNSTIYVYQDDVLQGIHLIRNLSLGGLFIEGKSELSVDTTCRLEIHGAELKLMQIYTYRATVIRKEDEGFAIEFIDMDDDSLMFLQTLLLYSSEDPFAVAEQFAEHFSM